MDLEEYRRTSVATWDRMAPGWDERRDEFAETTAAITEIMVQRLAPQPGQMILELAAGTGDTGFAAARALGPDGLLVSSDFSAPMVEVACRRAEELAIDNVEFQVIDAERIDLADDSMDGVVCRWAYMLMADPAKALEETRRVLRPGGRLVLAVWGDPERNPWATIPGQVMVARGHVERPVPGQPGIFSLADARRLRGLVSGAGFAGVEVEEAELEWSFADPHEYWAFLLEVAGALSPALAGLDDDERAAVREEIERGLAPFAGDDIRLPGTNLIATAS